MSEESQSSVVSETEFGPLRGIVLEIPNSMIITIKFDGTNYLIWSKSVLIHIESRDKEEYLTGEANKALREDPKYQKWKIENAMVKGWLLGSMKPEINDHYLFLATAHQI